MRTDLRGFPRHTVRGDRPLYRIHRSGKHAWWFSSDGSQRFDPVGTGLGSCYLAYRPLGAFVEVFRVGLMIAQDDIAARQLRTVVLGRDLVLADVTSKRALLFGVTPAPGADPDYADSQEFARRAIAAGYDGVRCFARHDPSQTIQSVALFATEGSVDPADPDWPTGTNDPIPDDVIDEAKRQFGYWVTPTP